MLRTSVLRRAAAIGYRTQADLAAAVGMSRQQLAELLRRNKINGVRLGTLKRLARVLGCPVADLVSDGEE